MCNISTVYLYNYTVSSTNTRTIFHLNSFSLLIFIYFFIYLLSKTVAHTSHFQIDSFVVKNTSFYTIYFHLPNKNMQFKYLSRVRQDNRTLTVYLFKKLSWNPVTSSNSNIFLCMTIYIVHRVSIKWSLFFSARQSVCFHLLNINFQ